MPRVGNAWFRFRLRTCLSRSGRRTRAVPLKLHQLSPRMRIANEFRNGIASPQRPRGTSRRVPCSPTMSKDVELARTCRERAEELHRAAGHPRNVSVRQALLRNARDYEQIASSLAGINQINPTVRRRLNAAVAGCQVEFADRRAAP